MNLESPSDPQEQERLWREFVASCRAGEATDFDEHWDAFETIFANRAAADGPPPVWFPDEELIAASNLGALMRKVDVDGYDALYRWSIEKRDEFWRAVIEDLGVVFDRPPDATLDLAAGGVTQPRWLPGARLNCVDACFAREADAPAIVFGGDATDERQILSQGDLEKLVNRVANGLREAGFEAGDGIALYMPMTPECVAAYLGVVKAGCFVISIADSFAAAEVKKRLEIGEAKGVVTVDGFTRGDKAIRMFPKAVEAEAPRAIVIRQVPGMEIELREGDLLWEDFLSDDDDFDSVAEGPETLVNVLFSSGTTGDPKAIPWNSLTPIKCAMDGRYHQDVREGDVVAWPTNIGWMMGPWLIFAALMNRATIALYEGLPTGAGFTRFVREARVTMLGLVPALVRAWRNAGSVAWDAWPDVRAFSSTGEASNRADYLWLMGRSGYRAPVIEYCGGTEIGGGYIGGTVAQPASPSVFTTPCLGLGIVLIKDDGREAGEGEMGEVYLTPPAIGLSQSLLNREHDPIYYEGCPTGPDGETLRRHGDELTRLAKGCFKAEGRADDTMNLGGIKVSSMELERTMDSHPAVYQTAAVAVPPEGGGADRLVVFVVLAEGARPQDMQSELQRRIARSLNPLFKIHDLVKIDVLPRTASNKIMRRKLRERYRNG